MDIKNNKTKVAYNKLDISYIREELLKRDIILLENKYISNSTKMLCENKDGYKFYIRWHIFQQGQKIFPIFHTSNDYTIENIKLFLKKKSLDIILISNKYYGNNYKMDWQCQECGDIFQREFSRIQTGKVSCSNCSYKKSHSSSKISKDEIIKGYKKYGFIIDDINNYVDTYTKILVVDLEGYKYYKSYNNLRKNTFKFSTSFNKDNLIYNLNVYIAKNNINSKAINIDDINPKIVTFICTQCGEVFQKNYVDFVYSNATRCKICTKKQSSLEIKVQNWLKDNNIEYELQKKFKDLSQTKGYLYSFDFYIEQFNLLIECDGEFHYKPVFISNDKHKHIENFKLQKMRDIEKTEYCKKNNYKLLRIPYWAFKDNKYIEYLKNNIKTNQK